MAHHYQDFFTSCDWRIPKKNQTSGSIGQDKKEENKEAKCSNTTKQHLDVH